MKFQRTFSCITGVLIAFGFAASQASAGPPGGKCTIGIEINALRGGSPTVSVNTNKDITAKARIQKGSAVDGTTIVTRLTIEAIDDGQVIDTQFQDGVTLGVGKGGQGAKLRMNISQCTSGIEFKATFTGTYEGEVCTASSSIFKTCK